MYLPTEYADWMLVIVGSVLLLFGSFALRSALTVVGAILGMALGLGAGHGFATWMETEGTFSIVLHVIGGGLGALLGVILFKFVELVAFFVLGSGLTAWGLFGISPWLERFNVPDPQLVMATAIPVISIIAGLLGVYYKKLIMGISTAAAGTFLIMNALDWPYDGLPAIALFVLGLMFQVGRLRRRRRGNEVDDDED
jgi:hypothetical protein